MQYFSFPTTINSTHSFQLIVHQERRRMRMRGISTSTAHARPKTVMTSLTTPYSPPLMLLLTLFNPSPLYQTQQKQASSIEVWCN